MKIEDEVELGARLRALGLREAAERAWELARDWRLAGLETAAGMELSHGNHLMLEAWRIEHAYGSIDG